MGFLDKAKDLAKAGAEKAKESAKNAKQALDEKSARADAAAIERENEGLSHEEIIAKDEAKNLIYFSKLKYEEVTDTGAVFTEAIEDGAKGYSSHAVAGMNVRSNTKMGLNVKMLNPSDRRIKYLNITVSALNKVGDVFETENLRFEGPIEPGKKGKFFSAGCFSKDPDSLVLNKVHIEYFDRDDVVLENVNWLDRLIDGGGKFMNFMKA